MSGKTHRGKHALYLSNCFSHTQNEHICLWMSACTWNDCIYYTIEHICLWKNMHAYEAHEQSIYALEWVHIPKNALLKNNYGM